jgi:hypothetical protein
MENSTTFLDQIIGKKLQFMMGSSETACQLQFFDSDKNVTLEIMYPFDQENNEIVTIRFDIPSSDFNILVEKLFKEGNATFLRENDDAPLFFEWFRCSNGFDFKLKGRGFIGLEGYSNLWLREFSHVTVYGLNFGDPPVNGCRRGK